jgi:large subunit ribosomal protein L31
LIVSRRRRQTPVIRTLRVVKPKTHPVLNNVAFVDVSSGHRFLTRSAMRSNRKETIDGEEYFVVLRDVTSDSHPAYTGERRLVDTAGRVEKFTTKFKRLRAKSSAPRSPLLSRPSARRRGVLLFEVGPAPGNRF